MTNSEHQPEGLEVELHCTECQLLQTHTVPQVYLSPIHFGQQKASEYEALRIPSDWDGVFILRTIVCRRCGAVDRYSLTPQTLQRLIHIRDKTAFDASRFSGRPRDFMPTPLEMKDSGLVLSMLPSLWDLSVPRRVSEALATLGRYAETHPDEGGAWRRLGNAQENYGDIDSALRSWEHALEADENELEASYSLMLHHWPMIETSELATKHLFEGIARIPKAFRQESTPRNRAVAAVLLDHLVQISSHLPASMTLMVSWLDGRMGERSIVRVSSLSLRALARNPDTFLDFMFNEEVLAVTFTQNPPEERPTQLEVQLGLASAPASRLDSDASPRLRGNTKKRKNQQRSSRKKNRRKKK